MSQDTQYADALRQSPVEIFKLWCFPYSLRMEGLLLAERNEFLTESPLDFDELPLEKRIFALDRATQVCSNAHFKKFQSLRGWLLKKARGNFSTDELKDETNKFWNYLNTSRCSPRLSQRRTKIGEDPGRPFGAPLLAQLHQFVMTLPEIQKLKTGQEMVGSAWDYPFGAAVWRYFTKLEMEGGVQIENDDEEKTRTERARMQNEYNDGVSAWNAAKTDAEKASVILQHPGVRTFAATEEAVRAFETKGLK
jgi:hypothetical protein